ncbi:MAG: 6-phosphofructokinase [Treponema sp.]|nr:6-phosphofructokinase [Treponema sp.]
MDTGLKSAAKTFGILTAGGDCPGLNAAIRSICLAAHYRYNMTIVGIFNGFRGLIDEDVRILKPDDFSGILTSGGTILGASREKPFKKDKDAARQSGFYDIVVEGDKAGNIKENYRKLNLDCLVVLGGNGTHTTAHLLAQEGLNVIGLPKTIDNDIVGTDRTFGFHSALSIGTEAVDRLHSTAKSHNRIMVIELMGHKTGWLALYAGVAGGGDVILIPEIPYNIKVIGKHIEERVRNRKGFSVVVVAEGALSVEEAGMDKKERKKYREQMPATGYRVAREIEEETGMETRATILGYVQRGGVPSASDRVLATSLGAQAAELLVRGEYGRMTALVGDSIGSVELSVPAGKIKSIPQDHYMIGTAKAVGTCIGI